MGGFVVLNTGLTLLETFGERYVFSSGYWPRELEVFMANIERLLADHGVRNFSVLSSHGHEWLNWRRYLWQTAQIMFPETR